MQQFSIPRIINPYSDDEKAIRRNVITVQFLILLAVVGITAANNAQRPATLTLVGILVGSILLAWRGYVAPGQFVTPVAIAVVSVLFMLSGNGLHDVATIGLAGAIVIAGLFLGAQGTIVFTALTLLVFITIGFTEVNGYFVPQPADHAATVDIISGGIIIFATGLSLRTALLRLSLVANKARDNESAQIAANKELTELKNNLEKRVAERTSDLEKRASQLETISRVARSISTVQDLERLLPSITSVVSEQFGFYHTGIFLLDERSEFAVLEAANSEGGQRMLLRGHRLRVGATGIVGHAAGEGQPRIALDVGADAVYFNNPDLPKTRSELALPLKVGSDVIGVLDVQSEATNAFHAEDINVLTTLANQVAIAIENARSFSRTRKALAEAQTVYDEYINQEWSRFGNRLGKMAFTYDGIRTATLSGLDGNQQGDARIPIRIRGVTVGMIAIHPNDASRRWTQDELNLVQATAERAGLAIENLRLLDEAMRRAAKERTIGDISSRLASTVDLNEIMAAAVQELGRALPNSEVIVQFTEQGNN